MSALGSFADTAAPPMEVRSAPESGHFRHRHPSLLWAKNRLMRCSKQAYSITWSARSNMEVGIVRMSTARLLEHLKM